MERVYIISFENISFWCGLSLICQWRYIIEKSRLSRNFGTALVIGKRPKKKRVNKKRWNFQCLKAKSYLTESPLDQELLAVALHLWMTRASDVWCLLVPGHSPALSSSTWRFSAIDSMTLIFWLLQSSGTSGCVVVVVAIILLLYYREWYFLFKNTLQLIMQLKTETQNMYSVYFLRSAMQERGKRLE